MSRIKEIEDEIKNMKEAGYSYNDYEMSSLLAEKKGILDERERILAIIEKSLYCSTYNKPTCKDTECINCNIKKDLKQKIKGEDLK